MPSSDTEEELVIDLEGTELDNVGRIVDLDLHKDEDEEGDAALVVVVVVVKIEDEDDFLVPLLRRTMFVILEDIPGCCQRMKLLMLGY